MDNRLTFSAAHELYSEDMAELQHRLGTSVVTGLTREQVTASAFAAAAGAAGRGSHFDPAAREGDAHLLGVSLQSIAAAIEATEHEVTVRTCTWFPMGEVSPFEHEHISYHHFPSHLGIALQILREAFELTIEPFIDFVVLQ